MNISGLRKLTQSHAILVLFIALLGGCEKTDSSLIGSWNLDETRYVIMPNRDFTFTDVSGSPWQGTVTIDNVELDAADFRYGFNNDGGQWILASKDAFITFSGNNIWIINYRKLTYVLEKEYIFDLLSGVFKVEGIAQNFDKNDVENQSVSVSIDMKMPKVALKKGEQFAVKRGSRLIPYNIIRFNASGKLQTEYLIGDIAELLAGKWRVNNNVITIQPEGKSAETYTYQLRDNMLLFSLDKITEENAPPHLAPFSNNISKITYQAVYKKE